MCFHFVLGFLFLALVPFVNIANAKNWKRNLSSTNSDILERILYYEDRRLLNNELLLGNLRHSSQVVQIASILALGRIGDPFALDEIAKLLSKKNLLLREYGSFALSLIGGDISLQIMNQNLPMNKDPRTQAYLLVSIGRIGNESSVLLLAETLKTESPQVVIGSICEALGTLWSKDSTNWMVPANLLSKLANLARGKNENALLCAFALSRFKGEAPFLPQEELLLAASTSDNSFTKAFLLRTLKNIRTAKSSELLAASLMNSPNFEVRIESAKSLSSHLPTPITTRALINALKDSYSSVVYEALKTLRNYGSAGDSVINAVQDVWRISRSEWLRGTALVTLAYLKPEITRPLASETLQNPKSPSLILRYAIDSMGILANQTDIQYLAPFLKGQDTIATASTLKAFMRIDETLITPSMKEDIKKLLDLDDTAITTLVSQLIAQHYWKGFAATLTKAYPRLTKPEHLETRSTILNTLALIGDKNDISFVRLAARDPNPIIAKAALGALRNLSEQEPTEKAPLNNIFASQTPTLSSLKSVVNNKIILKTTRGEIHLLTLSEAPMTSLNFIRLVRKGFYNGTVFHRIIPNFIAQGGDPRGDGFGGPGYFIRDELNIQRHDRGTVGMATAGKDTGGSQFFINLAPNHHLNGKYTVFARVIQGMSVADRLEEGDRILSATVP